MLPLLVIVQLTLLDALRRRILWVLFLLTVIVVGLSGLGFERLVSLARDHGSDHRLPEDRGRDTGRHDTERLVVAVAARPTMRP